MHLVYRASLIFAAVMLCACAAPRWENLKHPEADLKADAASCERDAQRAVKLEQLLRPNSFPEACIGCTSRASQEMQAAVNAYGTQKRCMAARGWRETS